MKVVGTCVCSYKRRLPEAGQPYTTDVCRRCWLELNSGKPLPKIAQPPIIMPYTGPVASPHVVATLAVGEPGREMLDVSGPILERYADRIGADFRVIQMPFSPWPVGEKWQVRPYFDAYERVCWLDADVIVTPDCPNLFDIVPRGQIGWHDDCPGLGRPQWVTDEYRELIASQGWEPFEPPQTAWNSGVYVADKEHAFVFDPAAKPVPRKHCMEQWHETLVAHRAGVPIFPLPSRFNHQWWFTKQPLTTPIPDVHVYHYAGMKNHADRVRQMLAMRAALYPGERFATPVPPRGECPELGRPLRADELLQIGIDPATCGCGSKVRQCAIHGACTTREPREGLACCMTCRDHPDAAASPL